MAHFLRIKQVKLYCENRLISQLKCTLRNVQASMIRNAIKGGRNYLKPKPTREQIEMICLLWECYMSIPNNMRQTSLYAHHMAYAYESQFDVDTRILIAEEEYPHFSETGMFGLLIDNYLYLSYWKWMDLYKNELKKRRKEPLPWGQEDTKKGKERALWNDYLSTAEGRKKELDPEMSQTLHKNPGRYTLYSFDTAIDRCHPRGIAVMIDGYICTPKMFPYELPRQELDDYCRRKLESRSKPKPNDAQIILIAEHWIEYILADNYKSKFALFDDAFNYECQFNTNTRLIYDKKRNDFCEGPIAVEVEDQFFKAPFDARFRDAFPPQSFAFRRMLRMDARLISKEVRERMEQYGIHEMEEKREIEKSDAVVRPGCPCCGSQNVAWIERGNIGLIESVIDKVARREVIFESGLISEDDMRWECNMCHTRFGNTGFKALIMRAKGQEVPDYIGAQFFTFNNTVSILRSKNCGCTNCMKIFKPNQIRKRVKDIPERGGALCPYCERDSVIGDYAGFPLTEEFLSAVHEYWKDKVGMENRFDHSNTNVF